MKRFKRAAAFCTCLALAAAAMPPFAVFADGEDKPAELPASFDLRSQGLVTGVKNEGQFETSWAFSAMNSIETGLIENNPTIDLSEWHLAYYTYSHNFGYPYSTEYLFDASTEDAQQEAGMLTSWIGPVSEWNAPMYGDMTIENSMLTMDQVRGQAEYHVTDAINYEYMISDDMDDPVFRAQLNNLKDVIYKGNALDASFLYTDACYDAEHNSYFYSVPDSLNEEWTSEWHSVSIVGWDDSFPAENFKTAPSMDGAWLCKDCRGTAYGDDGYFWLSYAEADLDDIYEFHAESADVHNRLYQHDVFGDSGRFGFDPEGDKSVMAANVFTAENYGWLTDVMFCNTTRGNQVEITIYSDLTDEGNPTSGTPSEVTTVDLQQLGYQTIPLNVPVQLHMGEKFAIVAKISGEAAEARIPVEFATRTESFYNDGTNEAFDTAFTIEMLDRDFAPGQSFYSVNGQVWYDMYNVESKEDEINLKESETEGEGKVEVLAGEKTDADEIPDETPVVTIGETPTEESSAEEAPSEEAPAEEAPSEEAPAEEAPSEEAPSEEAPAEEKEIERLVWRMKYGNICLKGVTRDSGTVTFSNYNQLVEPGEKISLFNDDNAPIYYSLDGVEFKLYNADEPIAFPEGETKMTITAYADMEIVNGDNSKTKFTRTYSVKKAAITSLLCRDGEYSDYAYMDAVEPTDLYYSIPAGTESIAITPIANGTVTVPDDRTAYTSGQTISIKLTDAVTEIPIRVSKEGLESATYTLKLNRYDVGEPASPVEPGEFLLGDVNLDGKVDSSDAADILIAAAAVGAGADQGLNETQIQAADVNGDGIYNAGDAAVVLMYAAAIGAGVQDVTLADFV